MYDVQSQSLGQLNDIAGWEISQETVQLWAESSNTADLQEFIRVTGTYRSIVSTELSKRRHPTNTDRDEYA